MNHHLTLALANQRVTELRAAAEAAHRAKSAAADRGAPAARRGVLSRLFARRRYREVELRWPDGVSSVISLPPPSAPADSGRGMASSKR